MRHKIVDRVQNALWKTLRVSSKLYFRGEVSDVAVMKNVSQDNGQLQCNESRKIKQLNTDCALGLVIWSVKQKNPKKHATMYVLL